MEIPKEKCVQSNPFEGSNIISKLLFWYSIPLFRKSLKNEISMSDLYRPLAEHQAEYLGSKLYETWEVKMERHKNGKIVNNNGTPPSRFGLLLHCILKVFGLQILSLGLYLFCLDILFKLTQPIFLGLLVLHYTSSEKEPSVYYYAVAVILCSIFNVLFSHSYLLRQFHCGMKVRIALMGIVYRKLLRLDKGALQRTTSGTVVNLLTSDVAKIDSSLYGLHQLWLGPLETLIVFFLVYYHIGFSAVAGLVILVLLVPAQLYIGKSMAKLRRKIADHSDVRIRLMKEIVRGVHVIKMYVWEKPFGRLIASARKREMNVIRCSNFLRAFNLSCMMFTSRIAIFASLVMYALLGQVVTAEKAFVITAYYNILRQIMMVSFPRGIEQLGETLTSLERVQHFMLLEEKDKVPINLSNDALDHEPTLTTPLLSPNIKECISSPSLKLINVKAKWDEQDGAYILDEISLNIGPGKHVAIIGHVGCGKSSIFQAILGEMRLTSGQVDISNGTLSYAPQEPWIFNGSVQQNILFNQELDTGRYEQVIKACALSDDLKCLPNGDMTLVGDHGQTLSGGQKARISLARAIYRKANIYLLDDPLSAVDLQVAKHLIEHCIHDFLRGSIVLLATHQVQLLEIMDKIIILEQGKVNVVTTSTQHDVQSVELEDVMKKLQNGTSKATMNLANKKRAKFPTNYNIRLQSPQSNQESHNKNAVGATIYLKYVQLGGGYTLFMVAMLFCTGTQLFASGSDYFLAYWVNIEKNYAHNISEGYSEQALNSSHDSQKDHVETNQNQLWHITPFAALNIGSIIVTLFRTGFLFEIATKASKNLHNIMYNGIINANMHFFQTNPAGRIINRVSKDMNLVDDVMPQVIIEVIQIALAFIGVIVVVAIVNPWSLLPTLLMAALFVYMRKVYLASSRNLIRMQGIARSPVYSHVIESLAGISTIQALSAEDHLTRVFDHHQDMHSSVFYASLTTGRAFAFSLDAICIIYIIIVVLSSLERCNAGELGLAITQAVGVTGMLQWGVRQSSEMENLMTSVERIVEYADIKNEKSDDIPMPTKALSPSWPAEGKLKFDKVSLWYTPEKDMAPILNGVSFEVLAKEKIGIVGRTGSGKSSLVNALFRLAFTEGSIQIDDENINQIPLDCLRREISVIPQEPILFSGSVRYNLDPFHLYSDEDIWCALESVRLRELVQEKPGGLDNEISEEGGSFSTGEKQLLCLARAILRKNKLLIMDEATANVDPATDRLIQNTIREKFKDSTVLVIAHRLDTVMDLDRVGIMDSGNLVEYGKPFDLLKAPHSKLFVMAHNAGGSTYNRLLDIARQSNGMKVISGQK